MLASLVGYFLAGLSLQPVEAMRRRAAKISAETPGERLPVPETRDELERLGSTLNEMLGRLEEGLQRERDFVADAGHELRTPLALLRTELELALRHGASEEELRGAIRGSIEEVDRLAQLADDLLLIARSERGGLPLRVEPLEARELLSSDSSQDGGCGLERQDPGHFLGAVPGLVATCFGDVPRGPPRRRCASASPPRRAANGARLSAVSSTGIPAIWARTSVCDR